MNTDIKSETSEGTFKLLQAILGGFITGLILALLPSLPMNFFFSLLLILMIFGISLEFFSICKRSKGVKIRLVYLLSTIFTACIFGAVIILLVSEETPRDSTSGKVQLTDSCSKIRSLFECGKAPDTLSQVLIAVRCLDVTLLPIANQKYQHCRVSG